MSKNSVRLMFLLMIVLLGTIVLCVTACVPLEGKMTKKKITIDRGTFSYREGGKRAGFPVIMVHGWPESSFCWEGVAAEMDSSFRIIAPDLRGLGDSERTMDLLSYRKNQLGKDIIAIADALDIDTFYLVGHDWGGIVAQEIALMVPDRVKKLTIMNIPIITNLQANLEARDVIFSNGAVPLWYQYFQQQPGLPEAMIPGNEDAWVSHFFKDRPVPQEAIDEYIRCYSIENTPAAAASLYRVMAEDQAHWIDLAQAGARFTMPTRIIYGNLDSVIIPEYFNHLESSFDSVDFKEVNASHFVQEEKAHEVAQLLNGFFLTSEDS